MIVPRGVGSRADGPKLAESAARDSGDRHPRAIKTSEFLKSKPGRVQPRSHAHEPFVIHDLCASVGVRIGRLGGGKGHAKHLATANCAWAIVLCLLGASCATGAAARRLWNEKRSMSGTAWRERHKQIYTLHNTIGYEPIRHHTHTPIHHDYHDYRDYPAPRHPH